MLTLRERFHSSFSIVLVAYKQELGMLALTEIRETKLTYSKQAYRAPAGQTVSSRVEKCSTRV